MLEVGFHHGVDFSQFVGLDAFAGAAGAGVRVRGVWARRKARDRNS